MHAASLTIDLIALALALGVIARRLAKYRRLRIDHVLLFSLGHAYYFSIASIMLKFDVFAGTYGFVYRWFDGISPERDVWASVWSLLLLVGFVVGAASFRPRPSDVEPELPPPASARLLVAPAVTLLSFAVLGFALVVVRYRALIAEGYGSLDPQLIQEQAGRGVLSAAASATILCALFTLDILRRSHLRPPRYTVWALSAVAIAVPSMVLLLAGGRMYVATSFVALAVWFTHVRAPLRRSLLLVGGVGAFLALTSLGALRTGALPDRTTLGFYTTSESVLTSISKGRFLTSPREIFLPIRAPKYLASDLTNVVPRAVLPGKDDLRFDPEDDGYLTTSVLGATQLTVSALINFGYIGSLIVFGVFAHVLSRLRRRVVCRPTVVWSITYACISASLLFSLFRDPFSISVVRWMLVNAVVLPAIYLAATKVFRRSESIRPPVRLTAAHTPS